MWRYFENGEPIERAGVKVVRRTIEEGEPQAPTAKGTWYHIEYLCCGGSNVLSHYAIMKRRDSNVVQCRKCAQAGRALVLRRYNEQRQDARLKRQGAKFKLAHTGDVISGTEILKRVSVGTRQKDVVYEVRYTCCGEEVELRHDEIVKRKLNEREKCPDCGRLNNGKKEPVALPDYGVAPPVWAKPPSIKLGYWPWKDV